MLIYCIQNSINGKRYIGQTSKPTLTQRWKSHQAVSRDLKVRTKIYKAMRKYGIANFTIYEIDSASDYVELNNKEQFWIKFFQTITNGYNISSGGGNCKISEDHRRLMSDGRKGIKFSESHKANMSKAKSGRDCSHLKDRRISEGWQSGKSTHFGVKLDRLKKYAKWY